MKNWQIAGIILGVVLLGTVALLLGLLLPDADTPPAPETTPSTTVTTVPEETTEPVTTVPEETTVVEETTAPETTAAEETTAPPETTVPETTAPPETTTPETTAPPETTLPPETTQPTEPESSDSSISLSAHHAFVYDVSGGMYLYTKGDLDDSVKPASMTKLYTAYVAMQHLPLNSVLVAGEEVTWIDPQSSVAYISQGHRVTVAQCIQGMLMASGNDAAYILAVGAGRAILGQPDADARAAFDAFVAEMNALAPKAGLTGSHFANPDGIDSENHYISPRDMCTIAKLTLAEPTLSTFAGAVREHVYYVSGESITWTNTNSLLHAASQYYCPDAIGLKTGHTSGAGDCLVSAFRRGDRTLIICVYGCPDSNSRYEDTLTLYEKYS